MYRCQPIVLIFQNFKIFEQRTPVPLSLKPSSVLTLNHKHSSSKVHNFTFVF